jgi:predicted Zn finger-like uncharacterized protein
VKFLCDQCKAKYQIADEKAAGKTVRMKCRRCGHLIEVRATVTDANAGSVPPTANPSGAPGPGVHAPQAPAAPRAASPAAPLAPRAAPAPLATSLASAKPPAREKPGALAGAFKTTVQRDEETSAPIDMSDLSPNDEWYVAINGVPVGPIRIAEIRRKAALGGVTEESLAWQEGLDEWRPVRHFPELAAIVREAITGGRGSLVPAPPPRVSAPPPPPRAATGRPPAGGVATPAPPPRAGAPARPLTAPAMAVPMAPAAAARSNVVPITSRLATAERLETTGPTVVADPFGSAPAPAAAAALPAPIQDRVAVASPMSLAAPVPAADYRGGRRQPPWIVIGMIAGFMAFGVTLAITISRPAAQPAAAPAPPPTVVVQMPGPAAATPAASVGDTPQPLAAAPAPVKPTVAAAGARAAAAAAAPANPAAAAPAARGPLDLHSLTQSQSNVVPTDEGAGDAPKAPGQCFSSGQVQQFVSTHQAAIQRTCWERNPSNRLASNVSVTLTVDPDGSVQGVSATGDDTTIAKCIENEVGRWHFPGMGCSQRMNIPFHFVRQ